MTPRKGENVVELRAKNDDGPTIHIDGETGEILDDEGQPTGRTLEDLTEEYIPPFFVKGTQKQLSLDIGKPAGVNVVGSMLKLKAVTIPLLGQYRIGDKVRLVIEVEVEDVNTKSIRSNLTGDIVGIDRIHIGSVEGATDQ